MYKCSSSQMKHLYTIQLPYLSILNDLYELATQLTSMGLNEGWDSTPITIHEKQLTWNSVIQVYSFIHSFIELLIHLFIYLLIHLLNYSFIHSLNYLLITLSLIVFQPNFTLEPGLFIKQTTNQTTSSYSLLCHSR